MGDQSLTANDHLRTIQAALAKEPEQVPPDWWTVKDLATRTGKSESQACRDVRELRKLGKVEWKSFRIDCGLKTLPVVHYRWLSES